MIKFDDKQFMKDMNNIISYSEGFLQGAEKGKNILFENIGKETIELLKQYIDTTARMDPESLHHVYEWYETGSPNARLFNLQYSVKNNGVAFSSVFSQSQSIAKGATTPFYDKAKIMESGIAITVKPRTKQALYFKDSLDNDVFVKDSIKIENPGGEKVSGSFQQTMENFFKLYFSQSFLNILGLSKELSDVRIYKQEFNAGKRMGRNAGVAAGYKWITSIGA